MMMYNQHGQNFGDLSLINWVIDLSSGFGIAYQLLMLNQTDGNNKRVLQHFIKWYAKLTPQQRKELSYY